MFWAAVLLPLFACCDGTNSTPLEEADGSKSEPIKLFPNVPIVVRCELQEEVKKHWMNVIGTVTEEGELAADLAAQYEKIYEKLLAAQFKGDNMQQKVQKANKQSLQSMGVPKFVKPLRIADPWNKCPKITSKSTEMY